MMEMPTVIAAGDLIVSEPGFSSDLFKRYVEFVDRGERTTRAYLQNLRIFAAWLRFAGIRQPRREDIIQYRDWLSERHEAITIADSESGWKYRTDKNGNAISISCRPVTVRAYLRTVRSLFQWLASEGLYPDIASNIHSPKISSGIHARDAFKADEIAAIESSIDAESAIKEEAAGSSEKDKTGRMHRAAEQGARLKAIYALCVNAGLRCIEISRLNIEDFEQRGGKATVRVYGKGHTSADTRKPIAIEVADLISRYLSFRSDTTAGAPLFTATGNRSAGKRIAATTVSQMLKRAMKDAGFNSPRLTAHSLRHSTGTAVLELTGDNIFKTQQYLRHANPSTTQIYLHSEEEAAQADIAERLYSLFHGGQASSGTDLDSIISGMTSTQIEQLTAIAKTLKSA